MNGAVIMGPKPFTSPSLQNYPAADGQVQQLAAALWGGINGSTVKVNKLGKGMVIDGMNLQEALDLIQVTPDFKKAANDYVLFIHRTLKDGSVYFISNQSDKSISIQPAFRVSGKIPELWNAVTGAIRELPSYNQTASGITVPLELVANESAFIIFRKEDSASQKATSVDNYPKPLETIEINGPWSVVFDSKMRGPAQPVTMNILEDWTQNKEDNIKYYSGTAFTITAFNCLLLKKDKQYCSISGM